MNILEQVIKTAIEINNDCPVNESRLTFATKDDAYDASEHLKEYWGDGLGLVYGPFITEVPKYKKWFEVSIPRQDLE